MSSARSWVLTVNGEGDFICHGDITDDPDSYSSWRAITVVGVDALRDAFEDGQSHALGELDEVLSRFDGVEDR